MISTKKKGKKLVTISIQRKLCKGLLLLLLILLNQNVYAQVSDSTKIDSLEDPKLLREAMARKRKAKKAARREKFLSTLPKNHNPKTATLLALIPGVGQIYNRRYWKLPIVYGGLGAFGYFTVSNYIDYTCYRKAYIAVVDDDPNTNYICEQAPNATEGELKIYRDNSQEAGELFLLGFTFFYGLTIIDAFVDAHLMHFDIDDDLSLRIRPNFNYDVVNRNFVPSVGLAILPRIKEPLKLPVRF